MSTLRVDRIEPYLSSSVSIEGAIQANAATTGSNTFVGNQNIQGTITASIQEGFVLVGGVGNVSKLVATSSFGGGGSGFPFTGDAVITGSLSVSGLSKQTLGAAANDTQKDIIVVTGSVISGKPFNRVLFGLQDYPTFGDRFADGFVFDYWDSDNFNFGTSHGQSGIAIGSELLVSGSGNTFAGAGYGTNSLRAEGTKSFLNQYANIINIGAFAGSTTDLIYIGHNALPVLRLSSLRNEITGSTIISGSNGLRVIGNQTITGSLILSSSADVELEVIGNAVITGSLTISSSAVNDLTIFGRQLITGPTTGQTPQLIISSSDASNSIGRGTISLVGSGSFAPTVSISGSSHRNVIGQRVLEIGKPGFDYPVFGYQYTAESSSILFNFTENLSATASYTVGVFDNAFTQDVELLLETTTTNGVQFKDIRSDTGAYTTFLKIAPNGGSNPPLEFKRGMQVTGSVSISDVLQLAQKDPLPTGAVGQLAVSASNLYYHNGSNWSQIN